MYSKISVIWRFYFYGLQGLLTEILWTAIWDLFVASNWKLVGVSSPWAFFIYAFSHIFIEKVQPKLASLPLALRGLIYLIWTYFWEFSTGYTLSIFNACPWNYEPWFNWHFMGLITLEYAPLWYFGSIFAETITIPYVNMLCWSNSVKND